MLNDISGGHITNLKNALGRTSQRQGLLMTNLANVNVPGYKRQDIDFHTTLVGEMEKAAPVQTASNTSLRLDGNNVDLETEVMSIAETDLRFQALSEMTSHSFSDLRSAIREGK